MSMGVAGTIAVISADESVSDVNLGGELDEQKEVLSEVEETRDKAQHFEELRAMPARGTCQLLLLPER